jgi:N-methylhydantoinase A/oxoprolinase/acetone carboxylase beta subunit
MLQSGLRVEGFLYSDFTLMPFGGGGPVHACSLAHVFRVPS